MFLYRNMFEKTLKKAKKCYPEESHTLWVTPDWVGGEETKWSLQ